MNGEEVKWLEKLFEQYKEDQQKYLDSQFQSVSDKLGNLKESVDNLQEDIEDVEVACTECIDDLEESTNKKIIAGSAGAVVVSLLLWATFGTRAIEVILKFISGLPGF